MRKEIKIGISAVIILVVFIWGLNFLKGKNFFTSANLYYAVYSDVGGLQNSSAVITNGLTIGHVSNIGFKEGDVSKIVVEVSVDKAFQIPSDSKLQIYNTDFLGSKGVKLLMGSSTRMAVKGDTLQSQVDADLMKAIQNVVMPLTDNASTLMSSMDSLIQNLNQVFNETTRLNIQKIIAQIENLVDSEDEHVKSLVTNLESFSSNLEQQNDKISQVLTNLETATNSLSGADINEAVNRISEVAEGLQAIIAQVNTGEGTLGQVVYGDSVYMSVQKALTDLDLLFNSIREKPQDYVQFSVFQRKAKVNK